MERPDHINFRYVKDDDYRIVPASGAHGGMTPDGQVIAHFFVELLQLPETVTREVSSDGKLGKTTDETRADGEGVWFERRLTVGVVMSAEKARSIGEWLIGKADEVEEASRSHEGE